MMRVMIATNLLADSVDGEQGRVKNNIFLPGLYFLLGWSRGNMVELKRHHSRQKKEGCPMSKTSMGNMVELKRAGCSYNDERI